MAASSGITTGTVNPGPARMPGRGGAAVAEAAPHRRASPITGPAARPVRPRRNRREGVPAWHRTHARGGTVTTYPDHILRMGSQQLAELKRKAREFERQLWDAHESLEYEMTPVLVRPRGRDRHRQEAFRWGPDDGRSPRGRRPARRAATCSAHPPAGARGSEPDGPAHSPEDRTADLVNHGRHRRQAPPSVP